MRFREATLNRFAACLALGCLTLALRAALLPIWPIPVPSIYDEFSYLLQADTFAHGRLTNPPHPMWQFFESLYIIQQPTYASRYPPGQSLFMAAGQVLFGHPWFGVWLSCGLMAAALLWALQAWVRGRWLLPGAAIILQLSFFPYWMNSYWGGAVAALGGALVIGAWARLRSRPGAGLSSALAVGAVLVVYTRPLEGLLLLIPVFLHLLVKRPEWLGFRIPVLLCGAVGAALLGYYHFRVTGSPWRMPFAEYFAQYETVPKFAFQSLVPANQRTFRHLDLEWIDKVWAFEAWQKARTWALFPMRLNDWRRILSTTFGSSFWILLLAVFSPRLYHSPRTRIPFIAALIVLGFSFTEVHFFAHYAAPFTALFLILTVSAFRYLRTLSPYAAPAAALLLFGLIFGRDAEQIYRGRTPDRFYALNVRKPAIESQLADLGGRHIILVHYTQAKNPHEEWIYNGADLDGSTVLWAQDMGDEKNRELLSYFPGRKFWRFEPDESTDRLDPYP